MLGSSNLTALGANGVFTEASFTDVGILGTEVDATITVDQPSAANGVAWQWSNDGSTVASTQSFTSTVGINNYALPITNRYVRLSYTNGGTAQTYFQLIETISNNVKAPTSGTQLNVSLGQSTGKVNKNATANLTTSATTTDQVVFTYTVTAGKILYLEYVSFEAHPTAPSNIATILGTFSLEAPSGSKVITHTLSNSTISLTIPIIYMFPEPAPISGGTTIRLVCTPAVTSNTLWTTNIGGYEK